MAQAAEVDVEVAAGPLVGRHVARRRGHGPAVGDAAVPSLAVDPVAPVGLPEPVEPLRGGPSKGDVEAVAVGGVTPSRVVPAAVVRGVPAADVPEVVLHAGAVAVGVPRAGDAGEAARAGVATEAMGTRKAALLPPGVGVELSWVGSPRSVGGLWCPWVAGEPISGAS